MCFLAADPEKEMEKNVIGGRLLCLLILVSEERIWN